MKIAFFLESMILGGAEKTLIDIVNRLDPSKYEVTVISIFKQSVYDGYTFQCDGVFRENVKYKWLVDNANQFIYRVFNHLYAHASVSWLFSLLVKEKYDIEIAWYEGLPTEFVAHSNNRNSRKYAWLHTDAYRLYQGNAEKTLKRFRKIYSKFDGVIGVSELACKSFLDFIPGIPTKTIYNVFNVDLIEQLSNVPCKLSTDKVPVFLTVGRFSKVKGYLRLLDVFARLKTDGYEFRLVMVGDGEEKGNIEDRINSNGLNHEVSLYGMTANPYCIMKHSSYLICSSYYEGFGNVFCEAILCNLPILSVNVGGVSELFSFEKCGEICENSDQGLYTMIKNALDNPDKRKGYIVSCERMKPWFDPEVRIGEYNRLFDGE